MDTRFEPNEDLAQREAEFMDELGYVPWKRGLCADPDRDCAYWGQR